MLLFNGDQKFESFYIKHFNNFTDLQNCTECFKNLAISSCDVNGIAVGVVVIGIVLVDANVAYPINVLPLLLIFFGNILQI